MSPRVRTESCGGRQTAVFFRLLPSHPTTGNLIRGADRRPGFSPQPPTREIKGEARVCDESLDGERGFLITNPRAYRPAAVATLSSTFSKGRR